MSVKIRMKRFGRTNRPEFRIVATDTHSPRDGSIIENLGFYHPLERDAAKVLSMNEERVKYWLSVGAQPSETITSILKKRGITIPWVEKAKERRAKEVAARRAKKGKGPRAEKKPGVPKAPKAPKTPEEAKAAADEKAKAAASKAAKREAKKAGK